MTRIERNLVALAIGILLGIWSASLWATGVHVPPVVVKPPVVVPTPPPAPPPPSVAVPPPSSAAAPETQPAAGGRGSGALGWWVMAGVALYFGAVIREHWVWCASEEREGRRTCFNAERDGLPR